MNIQYQLDVLKFIDRRTKELNSTSSIVIENLEKARPTMRWFTNNFTKCNFADTTQLDK